MRGARQNSGLKKDPEAGPGTSIEWHRLELSQDKEKWRDLKRGVDKWGWGGARQTRR